MPHSSLPDLADAVFRALNVPSLTAPDPFGAGCTGGVTDQPVKNLTPDDFPFVWYELAAERNMSGLGPGPWLFEVDVRIHTFSTADGMQEGQQINQEVIRLLRTTRLDAAGWSTWYQVHDATFSLPFELLNAVAVRELVTEQRVYVEETVSAGAGVVVTLDKAAA